MSTVRKIDLAVILLCLGLVVAIGVSAFRTQPRTPTEKRLSLLGTLPAHAPLLATLDLDKLRQSPLGRRLLAAGELPGFGRLDEVCGYDPVLEVRALGLVVPSATDSDAGDFGIAAIGSIGAQRLSTCASTLIQKRGGTPALTHIGSFMTIRDRTRPGGELAVRSGGPLLISSSHYLREMIDASDGRAPSAERDTLHRALRRAIGEDGTLVSSFIVPEGLLAELGGEASKRSLLGQVKAIALRLDLEKDVQLRAVIGCAVAESCRELGATLEQLAKTHARPLLERELGVASAERLRVSVHENQVRASLALGEREALALFGRLFERLRLSGAEPLAPEPSTGRPEPDEIVRPKR